MPAVFRKMVVLELDKRTRLNLRSCSKRDRAFIDENPYPNYFRNVAIFIDESKITVKACEGNYCKLDFYYHQKFSYSHSEFLPFFGYLKQTRTESLSIVCNDPIYLRLLLKEWEKEPDLKFRAKFMDWSCRMESSRELERFLKLMDKNELKEVYCRGDFLPHVDWLMRRSYWKMIEHFYGRKNVFMMVLNNIRDKIIVFKLFVVDESLRLKMWKAFHFPYATPDNTMPQVGLVYTLEKINVKLKQLSDEISKRANSDCSAQSESELFEEFKVFEIFST